ALLASSDAFNISLSPEWLNAILSSKNVSFDSRVLVASRDGKVSGLLPYYTSTVPMFGVPMTMIGMGGNLMSYHHEIVATEGQLELLRACLVDRGRSWDVFSAFLLQPDGKTAQVLKTLCSELGGVLVRYPAESSPYLPITVSWDEFLATKSNKFRHNRKRE